jgi:hypothetical protein
VGKNLSFKVKNLLIETNIPIPEENFLIREKFSLSAEKPSSLWDILFSFILLIYFIGKNILFQ